MTPYKGATTVGATTVTQGPESMQDSHEIVVPTQAQIDGALARVVTDPETGRQTLDGYYFPPDNDDPFNPRTIAYTVLRANLELESITFESSLSNRFVRDANLRCAAIGEGPLFLREDDPKHIRVMRGYESRFEPRPGIFRTLLEKLRDR